MLIRPSLGIIACAALCCFGYHVDWVPGTHYSLDMKVSGQYAAKPVGQRVLGAGKAIHPLTDEDELERIDREWKREIFGDTEQPHAAEKSEDRVLGAGRGELRVPSDEEWDSMDKEWRKSYSHRYISHLDANRSHHL